MAYVSLPRRFVTLLMISTTLVACSAEGLVPPAGIDDSTRVGAIQQDRQPVRQQAYPSSNMPVAQPAPGDQYLGAVGSGGYQEPPLMSAPHQQPPSTLDSQHQRLASAPPVGGTMQTAEQEGVNMDAMLGVEPVTGLAQEQDADIAEGNSVQPMVNGIGTDNPTLMRAPPRAQMPPASNTPRRQPVEEVAMLMPQSPMQSNRTSAPPGMMPQSEISCRSELRRLGVSFRDVARIADGGSCGIDYPLELGGLSGGVAIKPAVKLNCQVTLAFAKWVKYELVPSSRFRYMSGVGRITPMGGYSCRKMNSKSSNPWSEHAKGNAIDIGTITLKNGKEIDVRKKGLFAFREKGLLKAVRTDSCKYFSTVLGPGSDPNHWNHFHFDLRMRKSGYRHCD